MTSNLVAKIDKIEATFTPPQGEFRVKVQPIQNSNPQRYEVLLTNDEFVDVPDYRWAATGYIVPLQSTDLNSVIAEAAVWARFLKTVVDKSKLDPSTS